MASTMNRAVQWKIGDFICDILAFVKYCCSSLYCQLYRTINTCCVMQVFQSLYCYIVSFFVDRQKLEWKTHWQSPVCRAILRRKYFMTRSKSSLSWTVYSFIIASFIYIDIKSEFFSSFFGIYSTIAWYAEWMSCGVFVLNGLSAFSLYTWSVFAKPMPISPVQRKLFRITENDTGFEVKPKEESIAETKPEAIQFSSFRDSFDYNSSLLSVTPINYSFNSWASASSPSIGIDTTSSSFSFHRVSSPLGYSTPKSPRADRFSFRKLDYSTDIDSSYERPIKSRKHLEEFLRAQEEEKQKTVSSDDSKHFLSSITAVENSPMSVLSKCLYQKAYRLPNAESTEDNSSEMHCGEYVLNKLKITDRMLTVYCERIRKWICQTILVKIVIEIENINNTLVAIGLPEFQIGSVGLLPLNQLAITKAQNLLTLPAILPYLDIHLNQEYLVNRLKTLARGGCMGNFKWNAGGTFNDKQWCDDLPTDSALLMHFLSCYFDAHLPSEPHFPEGKPFSSKYFKKAPEKPVLSKDSFYIYQASINPPHFKVVLPEDIHSLQKGRNNLFCSLVVFLHHIKTKECGMLGRVNLGKSGLNILWILD